VKGKEASLRVERSRMQLRSGNRAGRVVEHLSSMCEAPEFKPQYCKKKKKREVVGMPVASERIGVSKTDHGGVEGSWNNQRGSDLGDV
jgi:hypothetical protein